MKIAYLDLTFTYFFEDYSLQPKRYGGGRIFAAYLKEMGDFHIFAAPQCFENLQPWESRSNCHELSPEQRRLLTMGVPVHTVVEELKDYDIILHPHVHVHLNCNGVRAKQVIWQLGVAEAVHDFHSRVILYNDYQQPRINNPNAKIYKFTLGTQIPEVFRPHKKEDFIFQCSRHVYDFNSRDVAMFCNKFGIKGYFGGPIDPSYNLLEFIDNKNTFYLGEMSEKDKLDFSSRARLYTLIHNWPTPFSLSAVEALMNGTPVACTHQGFWPSLIKDGVNGFFVHNEPELLKAWEKSAEINQYECYKSILKHNHLSMLDTLYTVFREIHIDTK